MDSVTRTLEQAKLVGRIRDGLRALGYTVPSGVGLGTPAQLAALAPAIAAFTKTLAPVLLAQLTSAKSGEERAVLFATLVDSLAARHFSHTAKYDINEIVRSVQGALGALAAGFVAYRTVKKKAGGRLEDVKISDIMSILDRQL